MKYKVDGWNNFCRVFELPEHFSPEFCFGGGIPTTFQMIDWFNPVPDLGQPAVSKKVWEEKVGGIQIKEIDLDELRSFLVPCLLMKHYIREDRTYLVLCEFGACFIFTKV